MLEKNVVGVQKKESQMPVFNSDAMDEESKIKAVSSMGGVTPISRVSIHESSVDSVEMWRYMSEMYKHQRLAKEKKQTIPKPPVNKEKVRDSNFQEGYEHDSVTMPQEKKSGNILDKLMEKLWISNLEVDPQLIQKIEDEEYTHPDDGVVRVSDIMNRNVICLIESMTIEQVASIFNKRGISGAPVVHYLSKNLLGVVTMSDIILHIFDEKVTTSFHNTELAETLYQQDTLAILEKPVKEIMRSNIIIVSPDTSIQEACNLMSENNIHRVVVTRNKKVRGILTSFDIVRFLAMIGMKK